jgi:hypothetical protein
MWTGWSRQSDSICLPWSVLGGEVCTYVPWLDLLNYSLHLGEEREDGRARKLVWTGRSRVGERGGRPGCLPGAYGRGAGNGGLVRVVGEEAGSGSELVSEAESGRESCSAGFARSFC